MKLELPTSVGGAPCKDFSMHLQLYQAIATAYGDL